MLFSPARFSDLSKPGWRKVKVTLELRLQTKVREDFTITGKASTRTRCLNSVFVFNVKELKQEKAEQKAIVRAFSVIVISL